MKLKLLLFTALMIFLNCSLPIKKPNKYFSKKYCSSCSLFEGKPLIGYKISMFVPGENKSEDPIYCGYEMDKVFSSYSNKEKVDLLEELLSFEGDTSICAKTVCNYGSKLFVRPQSKTYTIQIDALYLFTILTVSSYSPNYCPFPVLFDNKTGNEINGDQDKIAAIFKIYRRWFKQNKKTGFVNYNVPLRDNRFEWFSTQKNFHYDDDNFKIPKLDRAARVIGVCKD